MCRKFSIIFFVVILFFSAFHLFFASHIAAAPLSEANIGIIIFKFQNSSAPFISKDLLTQQIFNNTDSVKNYYLESSYNLLAITGQIYDPVIIPYDLPILGPGKNCEVNDYAAAAFREVEKKGNNLQDYKYMYFISSDQIPTCRGGLGIGSPTWTGGFSNGPNAATSGLIAHELGHAFGLSHANTFTCGTKSIDVYSNCSSEEYGDRYEVMGNYYRQLNAPHRMSLGWIPFSKVKTLTSSGTYSIHSLSEPSDSTQVLRIPKPDTNEYYIVEYRTNIGFDQYSNPNQGVSIRIWNNSPGTGTRLINPVPSASHKDFLLYDNEVFVDEINTITVRHVRHDDITATVEVSVSPNQSKTFSLRGEYIDQDEHPMDINGRELVIKRLDGSDIVYSLTTSPNWAQENLEIGHYSITAPSIPGYTVKSSICSGCTSRGSYYGGQTVKYDLGQADYGYVSFKYIPEKKGDANGDNTVDGLDYGIWLNHYNQNVRGDSVGDFNDDAKVDGIDYVILFNNFGL